MYAADIETRQREKDLGQGVRVQSIVTCMQKEKGNGWEGTKCIERRIFTRICGFQKFALQLQYCPDRIL